MSLSISDAELDAETKRQIGVLFPMIAEQLHGHERTALDFGCGAGRFTLPLAKVIQGRAVGFDPCAPLIAAATGHISVDYFTSDTEAYFSESRRNGTTFDLILAYIVLGSPQLDTELIAAGLVSLLAPDGLLILADHMTPNIPTGKWWRFRPLEFYQSLFARHGVTVECIGEIRQLENTVSILSGRNSSALTPGPDHTSPDHA